MKSSKSVASTVHAVAASAALLALATLAGCTAETASAEDPGDVAESADALAASKVRLPANDACRDVLAPLALGLADGAVGLSYTTGITVSRTSLTDTRTYTVSIAGADDPFLYEVELDNDSASTCFLLSATPAAGAKLRNDARSAATKKELRSTAPITITPKNDDCASTVKLLAQAAGVSAVGTQALRKIDIALVGETEDRDYTAHVHGTPFVGGDKKTYPNDYDFAINVSNDSAFKCFVQEIGRQ